MPSAESLIAFFGAAVLLALSPGPDLLFVIAQSAAHGRRTGALVAWGLCSGLVGHTALVALGVGQAMARSSTAMMMLRYAGAGYLLYLSWMAARATMQSVSPTGVTGPILPHSSERPAPSSQKSGFSLYRRGVLMNLFNPKVSLFFVAFLPQFLEPQRGSSTGQIAVLGVVFALAAVLVFQTAAFFAAKLGASAAGSARRQQVLNGLCSLLFSGLAARLFIG